MRLLTDCAASRLSSRLFSKIAKEDAAVIQARVKQLEEYEARFIEPKWKKPLTVRKGTLAHRTLEYLRTAPKEVFTPRPEDMSIIEKYKARFADLPEREYRRIFDAPGYRVRAMIDPKLAIEYARVWRFANKELNIAAQDWRAHLARGDFLIYDMKPYNYSSSLWRMRLEALVDFGMVTGFDRLIRDLDRLQEKADASTSPFFNPRHMLMQTPTLPTMESYKEAQELGMNPAIVTEAFVRVVGCASSSLRERLVGSFKSGALNEIGIELFRILERNGLEFASVQDKNTELGLAGRRKPLAFDPVSGLPELSLIEQVQVGVALFRLLQKNLRIEGEPVFIEDSKHVGAVQESPFFYKSKFDVQEFAMISLNPKFSAVLREISRGDPPKAFWSLTNRHIPAFWMPTPTGPRLMIKNTRAPLELKEVFLRADSNVQVQSIANASIPNLIRGLNRLGEVRWRPNWDVIQLYEERMSSGLGFGDMNSDTLEEAYEKLVLANSRINDIALEPMGIDRKITKLIEDRQKVESLTPASEDEKWRVFCEGYLNKRISKIISDEVSLDFARKFNAERCIEAAQTLGESFTIPYNLDFRGRCYPIPKSLNPIGDDFSRGVLRFEKAVPLGPRGFFWLKVHLANQFGQDKKSFDQRAQWTMNNLQYILDSVSEDAKPEQIRYGTNSFWANTSSPVQAYAACVELASAMRHPGGPLEFPSSLPVQHDGSCNGLQHYAAIARDEIGGKSVNLVPGSAPADVYSEVVYEVRETVERDAHEYQELNINDGFLANIITEWERRKRTFEIRGEPVFDPVTGVMLQGRPDIDPNLLKDIEKLRAGKVGQAFERRMEEVAEKGKHRRARVIEESIEREKYCEATDRDEVSDEEWRAHVERLMDIYYERRKYDNLLLFIRFLTELYISNAVLPVVNRSLVKQTVMTSVYGVTHLGAQRQIMNRLIEARDAGQLPLVQREHMFFIAKYLTSLTIEATENLFGTAFSIMSWLKRAGQTITRYGQPLSWTTPLGLPVTQTYRIDVSEDSKDFGKLKRSKWTLGLSLGHELRIIRELEGKPELQRIHQSKQSSAFPPNFVHSLDSTHMLNTSVRCIESGCDFAAVHDSYWCHAAHADYMSRVLREEFVKLHERDLLRDLLIEWKYRYPFMETFEDLPKRGKLNLRYVLDSPYFFS